MSPDSSHGSVVLPGVAQVHAKYNTGDEPGYSRGPVLLPRVAQMRINFNADDEPGLFLRVSVVFMRRSDACKIQCGRFIRAILVGQYYYNLYLRHA